MKIKNEYLRRNLELAVTDQVSDEYKEKGYVVTLKEVIGEYSADIVARKGNETIVIEIKTGKLTEARRQSIEAIGEYVQMQDNHKFIVIFANPPKEKKIEIEFLLKVIKDHFKSKMPKELAKLAEDVSFEEVVNIETEEVKVSENTVAAKGKGVVGVGLTHIDHNGNIDSQYLESFSFKFEMKKKIEKSVFSSFYCAIEVDTSVYDI